MRQTWEFWYPDAAAAGLAFARARVDSEAVDGCVLVHAAPPRLDIVVTDDAGTVLARGEGLERQAEGPMSIVALEGNTLRLHDRWPGEEDLGRLVILPGGEAGVLRQWWHAEDRSEWRWQVEFFNHV